MNLLVACEESQEVCKAFREKGHNAFSCDLQECSGGHPEWHIKADVLKLLNPKEIKDGYGNKLWGIKFATCDHTEHIINDEWDMLIAHPPCTYLSRAGACNLFNNDGTIKNWDRLKKVFEARDFFLNILNAKVPKIAVENPTPMKIANLPEANCVIQPYEHGEPYTKRTLLWLRGLPPITPSNIYYGETISYNKVTFGSKQRSKTFKGVAKAFADQWG